MLFIDTFIAIVFVIFNDTISMPYILSSQTMFESSPALLKYLSFSQIHVQFQL